MRVASIAAFALIVAWNLPATGFAQPSSMRPLLPTSTYQLQLDSGLQVLDAGNATLLGSQTGLQFDGGVAISDAWEVGAGWGIRSSTLSIEGIGSRTRVGAIPLHVRIGFGRGDHRHAFAVRLRVGAAPSLLGQENLSANGVQAFTNLEARWAHQSGRARFELGAQLGAGYAGALAFSGMGRLQMELQLREQKSLVWPTFAVATVGTTDIGWRVEAMAGLRIALDQHYLAFALAVRPANDPAGEIATLWLSLGVP